jgi:Ca2+-binding EF-hand superfamily protein
MADERGSSDILNTDQSAANIKKEKELPKSEAQLHNLTPAQLQQTYKTLKVILSDEDTFHHVVVEIFQAIDVSSDGNLDKREIRSFINGICVQMGLEAMPEDKVFDEVFEELDEDGSNDISLQEMKDFLRKIFICQRDEIGKLVDN